MVEIPLHGLKSYQNYPKPSINTPLLPKRASTYVYLSPRSGVSAVLLPGAPRNRHWRRIGTNTAGGAIVLGARASRSSSLIVMTGTSRGPTCGCLALLRTSMPAQTCGTSARCSFLDRCGGWDHTANVAWACSPGGAPPHAERGFLTRQMVFMRRHIRFGLSSAPAPPFLSFSPAFRGSGTP
jgi:hypothetical protein